MAKHQRKINAKLKRRRAAHDYDVSRDRTGTLGRGRTRPGSQNLRKG